MKMAQILFVDDELALLNILKKYLTMREYEVSICDDAEAAILCAKKNTFDIIFMDIRMPTINGIAAIKEIKKFDHRVNFIIMTAYTIDAEISELLKKDERICGIIQKPFDFSKLDSMIKTTITRMGL